VSARGQGDWQQLARHIDVELGRIGHPVTLPIDFIAHAVNRSVTKIDSIEFWSAKAKSSAFLVPGITILPRCGPNRTVIAVTFDR
jgi:hypothetical protein